MPSISNLYKQVYTLLDSACFVMGSINVPDGSWGLELEFPILSLFKSLLLMKLSVAPESTRTCLLVVECKDFKRVGICSDLYLLAKTIFDSTFSRCTQTDRVASFKNPL